MSSNTRITRSKGQPEAVSLPARMRKSRKSTSTSGQHPTTLAHGLGQLQSDTPVQTSALLSQPLRPTPSQSITGPTAGAPLMPRVQLPNSQFSGSHLSQLSGPLFTEDRYSASSGGDQESCDAEVDHITHHKTPSKVSTIPILLGRPTPTPDTVDYSTQGDPNQAAP